MTCSFKRALEITLLNRLTPNLKHFVIILHLDYFVPTIFCTIFCTEIREWYTKHIGELKYWENRSSSRRQKMWCLHITIELNKIWDEIVNNFITKQIDLPKWHCYYISYIQGKIKHYWCFQTSEKFLEIRFLLFSPAICISKNDLGGEHKILSVFIMIVGYLSIKYCKVNASTEFST